ncbi:hypothetical protein ACVBEQ_27610 [Nakamurella sp. GG22]
MFHGVWPVGDWAVLLERLDRSGAFGRWQQEEPSLAAVPALADLPSLTAPEVGRTDTDLVLGALIRVAAVDGGDDSDAALVVVHLLSAGVLVMASRLGGGRAEVVSAIVAELTCRVRSFPWRRRTRAYAANLLQDTKHAVLQELPALRADGARREIPFGPSDSVWQSLENTDPWSAAPDITLPEVVRWAQRNAVAADEDLRMLVRLHQQAAYGTANRHRIAGELGINERTLRRRRDRTLTALRAARPRFLRDRAA